MRYYSRMCIIIKLNPYTLSHASDVSVELPFVLMHPKPSEQPNSRPQSGKYDFMSVSICIYCT